MIHHQFHDDMCFVTNAFQGESFTVLICSCCPSQVEGFVFFFRNTMSSKDGVLAFLEMSSLGSLWLIGGNSTGSSALKNMKKTVSTYSSVPTFRSQALGR